MKHLLIILSILLLSSFVTSCDKKHGQGIYTWSDGRKYVGEFKNGNFWNGTIYRIDGNIIVKFVNGKEIKLGKYEGERKDGKEHGQGTMTYHEGSKYVGEWKNGKYNGQGTLTFPDGQKYVGEMKDGKQWNGLYYDKNGNIQVKFVNGKQIKQ